MLTLSVRRGREAPRVRLLRAPVGDTALVPAPATGPGQCADRDRPTADPRNRPGGPRKARMASTRSRPGNFRAAVRVYAGAAALLIRMPGVVHIAPPPSTTGGSGLLFPRSGR